MNYQKLKVSIQRQYAFICIEPFLLQNKKGKSNERVRADINKEDDPLRMLDLSLLCIYFLTGDKLFYEQNRQKLINIIASFDEKRFNFEN